MSTGSVLDEPPLQYIEHVNSVASYSPRYRPLAAWLQTQPRSNVKDDNAFIYLVDSDGLSLNVSKFMGHGRLAEDSLENFRTAISSPPRYVKTRLLVMDTRKQHLSPDVVDAIGMAYDIEPSYFASIVSKYLHPSQNVIGPDQVVEIGQSVGSFLHLDLVQMPPYLENHLHLWVKHLQQGTPNGDSVNIVLIIVSGSPTGFRAMCTPEIQGPNSTRRIISEDLNINSSGTTSTALDTFGGLVILDALHDLHSEEIISAEKSPLEYIAHLLRGVLPMHFHAVNDLHARHEDWLTVQREYRTANKDIELYQAWQNGRACLENVESNWTALAEYIRLKSQAESSLLKSLLDSFKSWLVEGRIIELHIREELQLHVGFLSIEQSRISIEASHQSIAQNYSVRRLTVIACIYLPLGLMTSAFGMNIKEFGPDGKTTLRVFFLAAGVLTALTLLCWGGWVAWQAYSNIEERLRARYKKALANGPLGRPDEWREGVVYKHYMKWPEIWKELKKDFRPTRPLLSSPPRSRTSQEMIRTGSALV